MYAGIENINDSLFINKNHKVPKSAFKNPARFSISQKRPRSQDLFIYSVGIYYRIEGNFGRGEIWQTARLTVFDEINFQLTNLSVASIAISDANSNCDRNCENRT